MTDVTMPDERLTPEPAAMPAPADWLDQLESNFRRWLIDWLLRPVDAAPDNATPEQEVA